MANLTAWLMALAFPLVKRVMLSLGLGFITYEGLSLIGAQVQNLVVSNWGALPASMLQILNMAGFGQFVGIILSAITARIALVAVGRIGKVTA